MSFSTIDGTISSPDFLLLETNSKIIALSREDQETVATLDTTLSYIAEANLHEYTAFTLRRIMTSRAIVISTTATKFPSPEKKEDVSHGLSSLTPVQSSQSSSFPHVLNERFPEIRYSLPSFLHVFQKTGYRVVYDNRYRVPVCVGERLTWSSTHGEVKNRKEAPTIFYDAKELTDSRSSIVEKIRESPLLSLGHLAKASHNKCTEERYIETFSTLNIAPQVLSLNTGVWHDLENSISKELTLNNVIHIYTGTLFHKKTEIHGDTLHLHKTLGDDGPAIPTHFFKVYSVTEGSRVKETKAFLIPNEELRSGAKYTDYEVSVEEGVVSVHL